jgi:hypothetical protein
MVPRLRKPYTHQVRSAPGLSVGFGLVNRSNSFVWNCRSVCLCLAAYHVHIAHTCCCLI